jgi:hypothetical protein
MTQNTPRLRMSSKRRHHIFTEHCTAHNVAPCCVCGDPIHRHKDRWIVEHIRPLALLGDDSNPNCAPAHYLCGIAKTAREARIIAKAKRQAKTRQINKHFPIASERQWGRPFRGYRRLDDHADMVKLQNPAGNQIC